MPKRAFLGCLMIFFIAMAVTAQDSHDNTVNSRDNKQITPTPRLIIPEGYTYPRKRFPKGHFNPVKTPRNDFGEKLTVKEFEKVLAQKRKEFHKRRRLNNKIDKKVARQMLKEYYFKMNYGFIPKKSEIKKRNL